MGAFTPSGDTKTQVESAPQVAPALNAAARKVQQLASASAHRRTGKVARSFRVVEATEVDGKQTAYVVNDDFISVFREFGTVNNPPERTLTRAAMEVGDFTDSA